MDLSPNEQRSTSFAPALAALMTAAKASATNQILVSFHRTFWRYVENFVQNNSGSLHAKDFLVVNVSLFVMSAAALYFVTTSDCKINS